MIIAVSAVAYVALVVWVCRFFQGVRDMDERMLQWTDAEVVRRREELNSSGRVA